MKRTLLLVAVGVTVLALVVGAALATPPNKGATTTLITRATLGKVQKHITTVSRCKASDTRQT